MYLKYRPDGKAETRCQARENEQGLSGDEVGPEGVERVESCNPPSCEHGKLFFF